MSTNPDTAAQIEIGNTQLFTDGVILRSYALALPLFVPILAACLLGSIYPYSLWTYALPLSVAAAVLMYVPGNPSVRRKVSSLPRPAAAQAGAMVVQLTLHPRLRSGLRAILEDADDFGWVSVSDGHLFYQGDAVKLRIPPKNITSVSGKNIGWRGIFFHGRRVLVKVTGLAQTDTLEFVERGSGLLFTSLRQGRQLQAMLQGLLPAGQPSGKPVS